MRGSLSARGVASRPAPKQGLGEGGEAAAHMMEVVGSAGAALGALPQGMLEEMQLRRSRLTEHLTRQLHGHGAGGLAGAPVRPCA